MYHNFVYRGYTYHKYLYYLQRHLSSTILENFVRCMVNTARLCIDYGLHDDFREGYHARDIQLAVRANWEDWEKWRDYYYENGKIKPETDKLLMDYYYNVD